VSNIHNNLLTCRFCGNESTIEEFDLDELGDGFWCNDCDGYTYFIDSRIDKHRFTLILEDKSNENSTNYSAEVRLNKRLSPLRYPGGKSKLSNYLYSKMQKSSTDTFVEAFSGGASVGLALLNSRIINHLILNDLDYGIYALFSIIKENPKLIINKIQGCSPTHEDYFKAQEIVLANYKNIELLEAAWSLLVVNRLAYSGICKANPLGGRNGTQQNLLQRWNPDALIQRITKINNMGDRITVFNTDACKLIEETYWQPATTILVDPPYYKKGKQLYNCYYENEDHIGVRQHSHQPKPH
jgi:DNA adenine methylase